MLSMKLRTINCFILILVFLVSVTGVSAGGSANCSMACDSCQPVQAPSCCTDDKMDHHPMEQSGCKLDDADRHGGDRCWLDCDTDPAVIVLFLKQGEKKYSLVPLPQLISTTAKLTYFPPPSGLPPPVIPSTSLNTLHCVFLI